MRRHGRRHGEEETCVENKDQIKTYIGNWESNSLTLPISRMEVAWITSHFNQGIASED